LGGTLAGIVACVRHPDDSAEVEVEVDYRSVVALEPEKMAAVVDDHAAPATLTLVRKARGAESHKGGAVFPEGSPGDVCITSWLVGSDDPSACNTAFNPGDPKVACP